MTIVNGFLENCWPSSENAVFGNDCARRHDGVIEDDRVVSNDRVFPLSYSEPYDNTVFADFDTSTDFGRFNNGVVSNDCV
jgi:hypothetical protein